MISLMAQPLRRKATSGTVRANEILNIHCFDLISWLSIFMNGDCGNDVVIFLLNSNEALAELNNNTVVLEMLSEYLF
jgi:hypothetical protein